MKHRRVKFATAVTLTEAMVTVVIVSIAALGGLSYQYHAAKHARIARAQMTATQTVQMLLEDWKSTGGSSTYDPSLVGLGFSARQVMPSHFSEGVGQGLGSPLHDGVYTITVDYLPMVVMLSFKDVDTDVEAQVKLRQLSAVVAFGEIAEGGTELTRSASWLGNIRPVNLSTYVRLDASGG